MLRKRPRPDDPRQLPPAPSYAGVYRAAAQSIRDHGWCHKGGLDRDGRICLLIAITGAAKDFVAEDKDLSAPALYVARQLDPSGRPASAYALIAYNDAPERTEAEVLALLDRLAA